MPGAVRGSDLVFCAADLRRGRFEQKLDLAVKKEACQVR
jgi:hypothetical protein